MHRSETKLFLNVLTDRSAVFLRCMFGVTDWNCMYVISKYCFRLSDTSLSMMCSFGVNPHFLNFPYWHEVPTSAWIAPTLLLVFE